MYGYGYRYAREHHDQLQRIKSVPVLERQNQKPFLDKQGRAKSLDNTAESSEKLFSDKGLLDPFMGLTIPAFVGPPERRGASFVPILLTIIMGQGALLFGFHIGFSSPTEKAIRDEANLDQIQSDLMFSILSIGALFGCLCSAPLCETIGRKNSSLIAASPFVIGCLIMALDPTFQSLSLGRFFIGIGVGLSSVLVPLYIAEIAPTHLRGTLGSANQFLVAGGIVIVNALGIPVVEHHGWWKVMLYLSLISVSFMVLGMGFIGVETPRWLVAQGRDAEAEMSLRFIRGKQFNAVEELNDIIHVLNKSDNPSSPGHFGQKESKLHYLLTKGLRPFLIGITLQLLQQWTGINAIMFHTSSLFVSSAGDQNEQQQRVALYGAIAVNAVQLIMCGVTMLSMHRAGRRFFLITSHIGMSVSGTIIGFAYWFKWSQVSIIVLVMAYLAFFSLGVGPLPWLVCSEIFPSRGRELAMSIATFVNWASAFGVTASMGAFERMIGATGVFWFYSALGFLGAIFVYTTLPETKGKTLEEIEYEFLDSYEDE